MGLMKIYLNMEQMESLVLSETTIFFLGCMLSIAVTKDYVTKTSVF